MFGHARTATAWPRLFGRHSRLFGRHSRLLGLNLKFSSQQLWACLTTQFCTGHCHCQQKKKKVAEAEDQTTTLQNTWMIYQMGDIAVAGSGTVHQFPLQVWKRSWISSLILLCKDGVCGKVGYHLGCWTHLPSGSVNKKWEGLGEWWKSETITICVWPKQPT